MVDAAQETQVRFLPGVPEKRPYIHRKRHRHNQMIADAAGLHSSSRRSVKATLNAAPPAVVSAQPLAAAVIPVEPLANEVVCVHAPGC